MISLRNAVSSETKNHEGEMEGNKSDVKSKGSKDFNV